MEGHKNAELRAKPQEFTFKDGLTIRSFKSLNRRSVHSPRIVSNQNKENAKNYGNQNLPPEEKFLKSEGVVGEANRAKSSTRVKKKVQIAQIVDTQIEKPEVASLYSNKANYNIQHQLSKKEDIITEGISKDGLYHVTSRAINGEQLKRAVELEHKMNLRSKRNAIKELSVGVSPRNGMNLAEPSKVSNKQNGIVKAYAVNTHQGISRNYNEDRVSIILNITKNGVKAAYFAVYDGHGGSSCCDFLSQNLHQFILNSKKFPAHPRQAIIQGMKMAEEQFLHIAKNKLSLKQQIDRSGSCAIISLIVGNQCFIANLGDSRAVLSTCSGKPLYSLSRDHKPTDTNEQIRIFKEGGKIYRTEMTKIVQKGAQSSNNSNSRDTVIGPLRVFPGKLSVTRTFGDIEAKDPELGGIKNCIGTDPQICKYTLNGKEDFILLGCDGIFQKMDSEEVVDEAWKHLNKSRPQGIHQACGKAAEGIVNMCMKRKSTDNLTVILVFVGQWACEANPAQYRSV